MATVNDARILSTELEKYDELRNFFTQFSDKYEGDCVLILDRGYRDVLNTLDQYGLRYEIPSKLILSFFSRYK